MKLSAIATWARSGSLGSGYVSSSLIGQSYRRAGTAPVRRFGAGGHASRPDVKQVDTTRIMIMLVYDRDSGVGDLHASDLRRLTLCRQHRGGWSSPRPVGQLGRDPVGNLFPQPESGIVTLSPVVQSADVAERHDSGRSAVVSLLGDRSPAVLNHLEHRWIVPDLLGALVSLLVPAGNHTQHSIVISGQPSFRGRSTTELFVRTGVPPFVRVARRGRNPVHEFVDRSLAAGLLDLTQRRRTHEIRLLGGCLWRMDKLAKMRSRPSGYRRVKSVVSDRHPRAIPAAPKNRGCQGMPTATEKYGPTRRFTETRRSATISNFRP